MRWNLSRSSYDSVSRLSGLILGSGDSSTPTSPTLVSEKRWLWHHRFRRRSLPGSGGSDNTVFRRLSRFLFYALVLSLSIDSRFETPCCCSWIDRRWLMFLGSVDPWFELLEADLVDRPLQGFGWFVGGVWSRLFSDSGGRWSFTIRRVMIDFDILLSGVLPVDIRLVRRRRLACRWNAVAILTLRHVPLEWSFR